VWLSRGKEIKIGIMNFKIDSLRKLYTRVSEQCDIPTKYNTNSTFIIDVDKVRQREPAIVHDIIPTGDKFSGKSHNLFSRRE
jgi:hypothetical protein